MWRDPLSSAHRGCVGCWSLRRPPVRIVGGLDIHRRQITFDYLDERSGQSRRGRIAPADPQMLRRWVGTTVAETPAAVAGEACTGRRVGGGGVGGGGGGGPPGP